MFPHSSFQTAGANRGPRTVSLDLPGLFKHPLKMLLTRLVCRRCDAEAHAIESIRGALGVRHIALCGLMAKVP